MKYLIKELYEENGKFKYAAIKKGRKHKEEFKEALLEELNECIEYLSKDEGNVPIFIHYAVFLLAEFKEKKAFPLILKLIDLPLGEPFDYLGYEFMDLLPSILASTYDGNLNSINEIIENTRIDSYTRSFVLSVYQYLYENELIEKEKLIAYLRKIIALISYENGDISHLSSSVITIITNCHLFEMINDVRGMYDDELVDPHLNSGYASFIDAIFTYDNDKKIKLITSTEEEIGNWSCFNNDDDEQEEKEDPDYENIFKELQKNLEEDVQEFDFSKTGRNDTCPCGSGKKFKKCCIDKVADMLPYQKYITASLSNYPKKNTDPNQVDFYTYYKEEYIEIDRLLYKAIKEKRVPYFIERDKIKELTIDFKYLKEAWELIQNIIFRKKFKTIDEYDDEVSIHYSLIVFFDKYCDCVIKLHQSKGYSIKEFEEIIKYFYEKFEITNIYSHTFIERAADYFYVTKKFAEGITVFENWLKNENLCRRCLCSALFHFYSEAYDYDKTFKKMDEIIEKENDKEISEFLTEIKLDYIDDADFEDLLD